MLQVVNDDMPFLVDSFSMALADQGIGCTCSATVVQFSRDRQAS